MAVPGKDGDVAPAIPMVVAMATPGNADGVAPVQRSQRSQR